ncbi:MAG TPA: DUF58 domain-containing protein [Rudaea sp.]|nr:DUF58 domain-containing protein [Rudaea sp.]
MSVPGTIAPWRSRLLGVAEQRLPALTRLKQPEALPIRLHRRRIYVLPTRFGLMYSAVLLVMLMGALNYNNNPALLLTCLLGAACYQSVFQAFRSINAVELRALQGEPCVAGDMLQINLSFHADGRARRSLRVRVADIETVFDIAGGGDSRVRVGVPAAQRGWCRIGRIRLYSEYPFGLSQVWSWLNPDFRALVYARPEAGAPPLPQADDAAAEVATKRAGDEFAMLRDYHPSDPRRSIAWKPSARHDTLLVKEFEQRRGRDVALEWAATSTLTYEARISRLAAWVLAAEAAQLRYVLRLPDESVGPGLGPEHRHACLRALALLPGAAA